MTSLYCYHVSPIDHWTGTMTAREMLNDHFDRYAHKGTMAELALFASELAMIETAAQLEFKKIGWEGDYREHPYFFSVPGDCECGIGYALKQNNNGSTFVASPVPLPSLEVYPDYASVAVF